MDVKLEQDSFGSFNIKLSGLRWTVITLAVASMGISMCGVAEQAAVVGQEKQAQTDIMRQQLEIAQKQYVLDSLQFYNDKQK